MMLPIMRPSKRVGDRGEAAMKQQTLTGFERYGKTTRRAQFLAQMDAYVSAGQRYIASRSTGIWRELSDPVGA